jgi:hypothetical protein
LSKNYHPNKFRNRKTKGFDSKREYNRAQDLLLLEKIGEISNLEFQVRYELIPKQVDEQGKTIERPIFYTADFRYTENGSTIIEDAKGMRTRDYIMRRKLLLFRFGIRIRET